MIPDAQNLYSDAQAITADAASTNIIDHGHARNLGVGEPLSVNLTVDVSAAGGGTLAVILQTATDAAFTSPLTVATTGAIDAASLTAGDTLVLPLPPNVAVKRFTRLSYDVTTMTGITITAALVPSNFIPTAAAFQFYPSGYSIQ